MATSSESSSLVWTHQQNKLFEKALVQFPENTPDRWQNVAKAVDGGKSVEDVKLHYQKLLDDVWLIENDCYPIPSYWITGDCNAKTQYQTSKNQKQN